MARRGPEDRAGETGLADTSSRLISGGLLLSGARMVVNVLGIVSTIVLARLLTPDDFGLVALGTTIMTIISAATEMSLGNALINHKRPTRDHLNTAWTLGVLRGLILGAILALGARPVAQFYSDPRLELVLYAFAGSVVVSGLYNPRQALLMKKLLFHQEFILTVATKVTTFAVTIGFAWVWQSYWALVLGTLAGQALNIILSYVMLPFRPRATVRHAREIFSFSIWLTFGQAISTVNTRFDQLLVAGVLGTAPLGQYSVGSNLAQIPVKELSTPLRSILFPGLTALREDMPRMRDAYMNAQSIIVMLALPAGIGFALVAEPVVIIAMGEKWAPAVIVIQALSAVFALQTLGSMSQSLGLALGETKALFVRDVQMFCIRLPIITAGILAYGFVGLVLSRVVSGLIGLLVQMILVRQFIAVPLRRQIGANWRSLLSATVMTALVLGYQQVALPANPDEASRIAGGLISVALGAAGYLSTLTGLWFLSGRPEGPERKLVEIALKYVRRKGRAGSLTT